MRDKLTQHQLMCLYYVQKYFIRLLRIIIAGGNNCRIEAANPDLSKFGVDVTVLILNVLISKCINRIYESQISNILVNVLI